MFNLFFYAQSFAVSGSFHVLHTVSCIIARFTARRRAPVIFRTVHRHISPHFYQAVHLLEGLFCFLGDSAARFQAVVGTAQLLLEVLEPLHDFLPEACVLCLNPLGDLPGSVRVRQHGLAGLRNHLAPGVLHQLVVARILVLLRELALQRFRLSGDLRLHFGIQVLKQRIRKSLELGRLLILHEVGQLMGNGIRHHALAVGAGVQVDVNAAVRHMVASVLPHGLSVSAKPALEHMRLAKRFISARVMLSSVCSSSSTSTNRVPSVNSLNEYFSLLLSWEALSLLSAVR